MVFHQILFYLLVFFLPTQLGFHFWPEWSYVLGRRVDYLSPTLYLTDIVIALLFLAWLTTSSRTQHAFTFPRSIMSKKAAIIFLVVCFAGLNIAVAQSRPVAVLKWLKVLEFSFLYWYIVKTKPRKYLVAVMLSGAIFYSAIIAMLQFFLQHSVGGPLWFIGERSFTLTTPGIARASFCQLPTSTDCREWLRAYATFPHPNVLAGFLVASIPIVIDQMVHPTLYLRRDGKKIDSVRNFFYISIVVIGVIALLLTFSRSSWAIGVLGITSIWYRRTAAKGDHPRLLHIAVYTVIILGISGYWISRAIPVADETILVRQELNGAALSLWQKSPLLGVGLGNFIVTLPDIVTSRTIYFFQPVHNIYLLILSETGIVGGMIFFFLTYKAFRQIIFHKDRAGIPYQVALLSVLLLGFVDHYPFTLQQGQLLLAILIGMSFVHSGRSHPRV